jgi:hypothetical protein
MAEPHGRIKAWEITFIRSSLGLIFIGKGVGFHE